LAEVLIVAATEPELCGHAGLVCGVGPVEASAATARALARAEAAAVLHVGIAGARREAGLLVGSLALGAFAVYEDLGTEVAPRSIAAAPQLVAAVGVVLPDAPLLRIGTTARVGGADACPVEAMEGFAVLRAAELAGVPAVEVRAISNHVEDERADWDVEGALDALGQALPALVAAITAAVSSSP